MPEMTPDPLPNFLEAGALSLLSGASGVGKTAFIANLAVAFHEGGEIAGQPARPTTVGYITGDRSWKDSRRWFDAIGFPEIAQYSLVDDRGFDLLKIGERVINAAPALIECIDRLELPEPGVIFVDPIALFLGGNLLNYHRVALNCIAIQRYAMDTGHCLVGVCHTSKQKADKTQRYLRMQDRINGTGALLGFTSTQMNLAGPDETGRDDGLLQCYVNPHHAKAETWYLKRDETTGLLTFTTVDDGQLDDPGVTQIPAEDLMAVYALLNEPPTPTATAEILERAKIPPRTLYRRLRALEAKGLISQPDKGLWMPAGTLTIG
jgi:hypothetical protein